MIEFFDNQYLKYLVLITFQPMKKDRKSKFYQHPFEANDLQIINKCILKEIQKKLNFYIVIPYSTFSSSQKTNIFPKFVRGQENGDFLYSRILQLFSQKSNWRVVWLLRHRI